MRGFYISKRLTLTISLLALLTTLAEAAMAFAASPSGEYGVSMHELTVVNVGGTPTIDYCDISGTASFSGSRRDPPGTTGTLTVTFNSRCSVEGLGTNLSFTTTYTITEDGEFEVASGGGPIHGRVLARGDILLLDGTTRTNPDFLITQGTMVRP